MNVVINSDDICHGFMAGGAAEADPSDLNTRPYNMLLKETTTTPLHEG